MTVVDARGNGLGDIALECWYPEVEFIVDKGPKAEVVKLFGGKVSEAKKGIVISDLLTEEYKSKEPRLTFRATQLGVKEIRRPPYTIDPSSMAWAQKIKKADKRTILIFPEATFAPRVWPSPYWLDLSWALNEAGYDVITLTSRNNSLSKTFPHWVINRAIKDIAALMLLSDLVISVDTGVAHIAGNMRVPTLALLGPTLPSVFGHIAEDVTTIASNHPCTSCNFQPPFRISCNFGCQSLHVLTPNFVLNKTHELLSRIKRYGRKQWIDEAIRRFQANDGNTIVEIGSTRNDHIDAEGCATIAWERYGTEVYTVDIDAKTSRYVKALCPKVNAVTQDGVAFLREFDKPIDLLYLDGLDGFLPGANQFALDCYQALRHRPKLILIDDVPSKAQTVIPKAVADGYELVFKDYVALLNRV